LTLAASHPPSGRARTGSACATRRSTRSPTVGCGGTPRRAAGSPRRPGKTRPPGPIAPNSAAARAPCSPRSFRRRRSRRPHPARRCGPGSAVPPGSSAVGSTTRSAAPNFMRAHATRVGVDGVDVPCTLTESPSLITESPSLITASCTA
jgi:hypothetical protein